MLVNPSGKVTEVSPLQKPNASPPMLVNPSGKVTEVSPVHLKNALPPMLVTPSFINTEYRLSSPYATSTSHVTMRSPCQPSSPSRFSPEYSPSPIFPGTRFQLSPTFHPVTCASLS